MNNLVKHFFILRQAIFIICLVAESFIVNNAFAKLPIDHTDTHSQTTPSSNNNQFNPEQFENEIKTKRNELSKEIDDIQKNLETESSAEVINTLNKQKTLLKNIDQIYTEQLDTIQELLSSETSINHVKEELEKVKTSTPPEHPSFLELDNLRDEMKEELGREDLIDAQIKAAQTIFEQAQTDYESKEKVRRQIKESLDKSSEEGIKQSLSVQLKSAQLESQYAEETVHLHELQLRKEKFSKDLHNVQLNLYKQQIMLIEKNAIFTKDDLQKKLEQLDKEEFDLKELLIKVSGDKEIVSKSLSFVREKIAQSTESDKVIQEKENALELKLNALQVKIDIINLKLDYITKRKTAWERRYAVNNKRSDRDTLNTWENEAEDILSNLKREIMLFQLRISDRQKELTTLQSTIEHSQNVSQELSTWLEDEHNTLQDIINTLQNVITSCEIVLNLYIKLINEIKAKTSGFSLWVWIVKIIRSIKSVWNYEIYVYKKGEIEKAYYVKTIFLALFFLTLGFITSKIVSRFASRLLIQKLKFNEAASSTIEFITYYFLLLLFFLYTLKILNVPLAIFTFFGGAFAIAIGFGSQNILKNFISGLILFIERPVRVGDFIEIEGVIGKVTLIAARSTHIKSFTNLDIILPNSSFLENKITNWTLKDSVIRSEINIGVSYDSQTEKVEEILLNIVKEHREILKYPEPVCYFISFGDSTLDFVVWYWIDIGFSSRFAIDSQIRHTIIKQFRKEGITIAFPQKDIHMDTQAPLDIRILSG